MVPAVLRSFVQRDLMRSLRLFFLVSLVICATGLTVQVAHMGVGAAVTRCCAVAEVFVIALRVFELRRARPLPIWADAVELAAVFGIMSQVTDVAPMISTIFMPVLFRAAIGSLPRLLLSQAGYLGVWVVAIAMPWHIEAVPGAMISLPITTLMVFGTRSLMAKLQEQQKAQNALLAGVLTELPFPVVVTDAAGTVVLANPAVAKLVGWPQGGTPDLRSLRLHDLEGCPVDLHALVAECGAHGNRTNLEGRIVRTEGTPLQVVVQTAPMDESFHQGQGRGVLLALQDVTAQRSYEEELHRAAYYDTLTGLPNRRLLFERLAVAYGAGASYALLLIDLNDFKVINDTLGHKIGDEVLAGMAQRILSAVDDSATVARLGGDEFAVLLPHATQAQAGAAAQAICAAFAGMLQLSCGPVQGRGTVGIAVAVPGETPDQVLEKADVAMYLAKPPGKRRVRAPESPRSVPSG